MKLPVIIKTIAYKTIGYVDVNSKYLKDEYRWKADELWHSQGHIQPSVNIHNIFELGEWKIDYSVGDGLGE